MKIHSKNFISCLVIIFFFFIQFKTNAQNETKAWADKPSDQINNFSERKLTPSKYRTFAVNIIKLRSILSKAPMEGTDQMRSDAGNCIVSLPMPDGSESFFSVLESPIMEKELALTYSLIKTYFARQIDDPTVTARLDITELGFHAMIMSNSGWSFIDPVFIGNTSDYLCYYKKDSRSKQDFVCGVITENTDQIERKVTGVQNLSRSNGTQLRTYRLALACTGEYAAVFGGTKSAALSAMATSVNRVSGVYEKEVAVKLILIGNDSLIVYTNAATDPYTNNNGSTLLTENQSNITSVIGSANYDIGHVFSTGGGGIAGLGVVCTSGSKARGVTGSGAPFGDGFDIDYVAHEIGHQFKGNHTFNSVTSSCGGGNRNAGTAYEVGSGITIMAYAGICSTDNLAPNSIAYFHTKSFEEIVIYSTTGNGNTCPVITNNGNFPPVVNRGSDYSIPISTPFELTGSATDANGDVLTYSWEEMDSTASGGSVTQTQVANLDFPLFRPFEPVTSPSRIFPKISDIVNNTTTIGERLPTVARVLDFRLTARDNRANGGGVSYNDTTKKITVVASAGPFIVTVPNTSVTWNSGSLQTVTWNVANTSAAPISCSNVKISLSNDGGYTYPTVILASTANDGSEAITVPGVLTTQARIKVEAVDNVFFDISNVNFTIQPGVVILTTITTQALASNKLCVGATLTVNFIIDGPANAGNVFTAQLSNTAGSFASGVTNIGTLNSINAGVITATIPFGTTPDTSYRIRVVSSNPVVTGSNNGNNISIYSIPAPAGIISGSSVVCQGQNGVTYTVPVIANATVYNWTIPSGATIATGVNTAFITVNFSAAATSPLVFTVTGANPGCSGTISPNYNITVNTLPVAAGSIIGTSIVCQGQNGVTFSVAPISGASGYNWTLPAGATITSPISNTITVGFSGSAVSGNVIVSGTNSCGAGTSSSFAILVNTLPTAPFVTAGGSTTVCAPSTVSLSFTPQANTTYNWRFNGADIIGATGSTYVATQSGNYDVIASGISQNVFSNSSTVLVPDNSCTGATSSILVGGYTGSIHPAGISIKINLTHPWVGDLALFLQAPNGEILGLSNRVGSSGDNYSNTVFADSGSNSLSGSGTPPYTGLFKPWPSSINVCITSNKTTFTGLGSGSLNPNGTWSLRVIDVALQDSGTIDNWVINFPKRNSTCIIPSNIVNVNIAQPVTASVNINSNTPTTVCSGTSVTYTANATNPGINPVYQWKKNGVNVGMNSSSYVNPSPVNNDTIICILISDANCVTGSPSSSNEIVMTVIPPVNASVNITASPSTTVCNGTTVTFTAHALNRGTSPVYQWKKNGVNTGINDSIYIDPALANNDSITCVLTSNATCVNGSPATSNLLTMTVNPVVTATITINASPSTNVCSGTIVDFTANATNPGNAPVYQWLKNGSAVGNNSNIYSDPFPINNDSITCVLTSNATCVSTVQVTSDILIMTVNPTVTASVSINASPSTTVCSGTAVTYTANAANTGNTPVYQWKKNGVNVGSNSNIFYNPAPANNDSIICILTSNAECINGNPAISNELVMTVDNVVPSISGFTPSSGMTGTLVDITGSGFNIVSAARFNGLDAVFTIVNGNLISAAVPIGASTGNISVIGACGDTAYSAFIFTVIPSTVLKLDLFIEGFYNGNGVMRNTTGSITDTILVQLFDTSNIVVPFISRQAILKNTGNATVVFPDFVAGHFSYIAIRHRNTVETWSKAPVSFTPVTNFNFKQ